MKTKSNLIFKALHLVAWLIFVGLCIEAGALLVNFLVSIFKPEFVQNLYQKMNLLSLYRNNSWQFYLVYSLLLTIEILKCIMFYYVVMLLYNLDLNKPFNNYVSNTISKISYYTFSVGIVCYIAKEIFKKIQFNSNVEPAVNALTNDSEAFIIMSAVIYIITQIFKKGIEIQNENELTI